MFITYLQTIFYIPVSRNPLVIAVKLKTKLKFSSHAHNVIVLHSKKNYNSKSCTFLHIYYCPTFQDHTLSGTIDAPTSKFHVSATLLPQITGHQNKWGLDNIYMKFHEYWSIGSKVDHAHPDSTLVLQAYIFLKKVKYAKRSRNCTIILYHCLGLPATEDISVALCFLSSMTSGMELQIVLGVSYRLRFWGTCNGVTYASSIN
jgi:hypothetical protein